MAISIVGTPTTVRAGTTASPIAVPYVSGTQSGDVGYILIVLSQNVAIVSADAGWTLIAGPLTAGGGGSIPRAYLHRRVFDGAESGTADFGKSTTDSQGGMGAMWVTRGLDNTTPEDAAETTATGSSAAADPASITTVTDNAFVFAIAFKDDGNVDFSGFPTGYTNEVGDFWGSGGNGSAYSVDYKEVATAGAENPGEGWGTFTLAVRPAAAGGQPARSMHQFRTRRAA